jgi:hypothetical protein
VPYVTDERLKSYLDTNQLHREQMCLAVMAIDRRFSDVRPRHPRGGPDGARDIEAVFKSVLRVFGAVGFVNQANDSKEHKKKTFTKFDDDLIEALKQDPKPQVFVFFTNVNLTVGEKDDLVAIAKGKGLSEAEVFDRERIRLSLDNPDGLSIRFQYLSISLSESEQATFFARWGDDIQGVITDGFGKLQKAINRIQFLQEMNQFLRHFTAVLELDREYSGSEIGHYRAFSTLQLKGPVHGIFSIMFGATDNSERGEAKTEQDLMKGRAGICGSLYGGQWEMRIPEDYIDAPPAVDTDKDNDDPTFPYVPAGNIRGVGLDDPVKTIGISYRKDQFIRFSPNLRLQDFDECMFIFCLSASLAEKIHSIKIYANEYKVAEMPNGGFTIDRTPVKYHAPLLFSDSELADPWVRIRPANLSSAFHIRFSEHTPRRFIDAREIGADETLR